MLCGNIPFLKLLIPSKDNLTSISNDLKILHSLLTLNTSDEKPAIIHLMFPLYVMCYFALATFSSLSFVFSSFIIRLVLIFCVFILFVVYIELSKSFFLIRIMKHSTIIQSNISPAPFSLSLPSGILNTHTLGPVILSHRL